MLETPGPRDVSQEELHLWSAAGLSLLEKPSGGRAEGLSLPEPIGDQFTSLYSLEDGHRATEVGIYHAGFGLCFDVMITFNDPILKFWKVRSVPLYIGRI